MIWCAAFQLVALPGTASAPMVRALNGVTLSIAPGETLAVVGESGCGKSTLARALVRLIELDSGQIRFCRRGCARAARRCAAALQPPRAAGVSGSLRLAQPAHDRGRDCWRRRCGCTGSCRHPAVSARITELLSLVRLPADAAQRFPHEFSGGQRQRIAIARALSVQPELLIADEIVSALDVSVQAQILNLLLDLQRDLGLAILFVSHDLRVVRHLAHRVAVMYLGRVVELGEADAVFGSPLHPYTQALLRAAPQMRLGRRDEKVALAGELPSPLAVPAGCPFHPRCPLAFARCRVEMPALHAGPDCHRAECHLAEHSAPMAGSGRTW